MRHMRNTLRTPVGVAVAALLLWTAIPAAADAQRRPIQFSGRVSWIAAEKMVVDTDDGIAVTVDLTAVPQAEYQRLASGDRVVVTGALGRYGVAATTIQQE